MARSLRSFLLRGTAIGSGAGDAPAGFMAPLDAALATVGRVADAGHPVSPFTLECSARITREGIERRRYTIACSASQLGPHPFGVIQGLAAGLRPPAAAAAWLERLRARGHLPATTIVGVQWSDEVARRTGRLYLEQPSLEGMLGLPPDAPGPGPTLAMLSLEWPLSGAGDAVLRRYHELPDAMEWSRRVGGWLGDRAPAALTDAVGALLGELTLRNVLARSDAGVAGDGAGARSLHFVVRNRPLARVGPRLITAAVALGGAEGPVAAWLGDVPTGLLRVLSIGHTRSGDPHVTVYYGPPDPGATPAQTEAPGQDLDQHPGAVVLQLVATRRDARAEVTILPAPARGLPAPAAGNADVQVFTSSGFDAGEALPAELAGCLAAPAGGRAAALTIAARVALRERTLAALLLARGWRLARWSTSPVDD